MKIAELRKQLDRQKEICAKQDGATVMFSEEGPAVLSLVKLLIDTLEEQEKRIAKLEIGSTFQ